MDEIIITLPSNSEAPVYRGTNKLSRFTVQLARPLVLNTEKRFSLGLCEINIPWQALPTDLDSNKDLYVYCNLVSPQYTGDSYSRLLRLVRIQNNKETYEFNKIYYRPLEGTRHTCVDIFISNQKGENYPFGDSELPCVVVLSVKES